MNKVTDTVVPRRLRNLVNRLTRLEDGKTYSITLVMLEGRDPIWTVQTLGNIENDRQPRADVLK